MKTLVYWVVVTLPMISLATTARADLIASDNASSPAYSSGWNSGTNGGVGLDAWNFFQKNGAPGPFSYSIGDSTDNGSPGINSTGNKAFEESAASSAGNQIFAARPFTGDLAAGQTFSMDFSNGAISSGGSAGFYLANSTGAGEFTVFLNAGAGFYSFKDGSGTQNTTLSPTVGGLHMSITMSSPTSYSFTLTELANGLSFSSSGTLAASVDQVVVFDNAAGNGAGSAIFANNLQITSVPEPSTFVIALAGAFALAGHAVYRRERQRRVRSSRNA